MKWFHTQVEAFRQGVRDAAHSGKPGIEVLDNWTYSYRSTDSAPDDVDYLFADVPFLNEAEGIGITARSFALTGKKFEIHNTAFLQVWGEWGLKPTTTLKREAGLLLSNGTNVHMGYQYHPSYRVEEGVWDAFKEVFDFVREREDYLKHNEIIPYIGAYMSNVQHGLTHTGDLWSEPVWMYGFHKLMMDCGLHYNMLNSQYMRDTIDKFRVVFLPDVRHISDGEKEILSEYVCSGGILIASGLVGTCDGNGHQTGDCKIADLLGIDWVGTYPDVNCYIEIADETLTKNTSNMRLTMEAPTGLVNATTAEKLATVYNLYKCTDGSAPLRYPPAGNDTGHAAITIHPYDKGTAVYFASDIGMAYYKSYQWNLIEIIKNLLYDKLAIQPMLRVTDDGTCEVTLTKRGSVTQVHIVNMVGTMPNTKNVDARCMIKEVVPLSDIKVRVEVDDRPSQVILRPQNLELPFEVSDSVVCLTLPKVGLYEIVEIS